MRIGIIELMNSHYTLVDTLTRVFTEKNEDEVYIFINETAREKMSYLSHFPNVNILTRSKDEKMGDFVDKINTLNLDLQFITTLEYNLSDFLKFPRPGSTNLFIHNLNNWTGKGSFALVAESLREKPFHLKKFLVYIKRAIFYPFLRKKIAGRILSNGGKFVVLTERLKEHLANNFPREQIIVIPFRIYQPEIMDSSPGNEKLRVCIPGLLNTRKRDYRSVIGLIENDSHFYKENVIFDFLGKIPHPPGQEEKSVLKQISKLKDEGIELITYDDYIDTGPFNENIAKADILLGNMYINLASETYGITKETGVIFNMVSAGKPVLLPSGYFAEPDLEKGIVRFENYEDLDRKIKSLVHDREALSDIKSKAVRAASNYSAENVRNSVYSTWKKS